ncbi:MAG: hypothetical protein HQL13_00560 [Candidatus Omnitrophica bacterium]|nr:hypothetical protein [Candidatus Omnitrophota bacterium]
MLRSPLVVLTLASFLLTGIGPMPVNAYDYRLPAPGVMVHLSLPFNPPILKGIKVHPENPFYFDFILDKGDSPSVIAGRAKQSLQEQLKTEATKLIKYFLASITIPEKDLWVNLSPYEKYRIIPQSFGLTQMGRDLLALDYILKQITASLIYPEDEVGKRFWKKIYEETAKKYGTTDVLVNTFNKVWIVPEKAVVYENTTVKTAYVVESKLKVMLEEDYVAMFKHGETLMPTRGHVPFFRDVSPSRWPSEVALNMKAPQGNPRTPIRDINALGSKIIREIVIPELTKEVNENRNFASLRQVYNSVILAIWYKKKIKDSIFFSNYADKSKIVGVNIDDPNEKEKIYQQYLKAFKKGVYNYIKEEIDPVTQEMMPKKYFSGGVTLMSPTMTVFNTENIPAGLRHDIDKAGASSNIIVNTAMTIKTGDPDSIDKSNQPIDLGVIGIEDFKNESQQFRSRPVTVRMAQSIRILEQARHLLLFNLDEKDIRIVILETMAVMSHVFEIDPYSAVINEFIEEFLPQASQRIGDNKTQKFIKAYRHFLSLQLQGVEDDGELFETAYPVMGQNYELIEYILKKISSLSVKEKKDEILKKRAVFLVHEMYGAKQVEAREVFRKIIKFVEQNLDNLNGIYLLQHVLTAVALNPEYRSRDFVLLLEELSDLCFKVQGTSQDSIVTLMTRQISQIVTLTLANMVRLSPSGCHILTADTVRIISRYQTGRDLEFYDRHEGIIAILFIEIMKKRPDLIEEKDIHYLTGLRKRLDSFQETVTIRFSKYLLDYAVNFYHETKTHPSSYPAFIEPASIMTHLIYIKDFRKRHSWFFDNTKDKLAEEIKLTALDNINHTFQAEHHKFFDLESFLMHRWFMHGSRKHVVIIGGQSHDCIAKQVANVIDHVETDGIDGTTDITLPWSAIEFEHSIDDTLKYFVPGTFLYDDQTHRIVGWAAPTNKPVILFWDLPVYEDMTVIIAEDRRIVARYERGTRKTVIINFISTDDPKKIAGKTPAMASFAMTQHHDLDKGGIDLTAGKVLLEIQHSGRAIKLQFNQAQLAALEKSVGFEPMVTGWHLVGNLREFLDKP